MHRHTNARSARPVHGTGAARSSEWMDAMMRDLSRCPPGPRQQGVRAATILALMPLARRVARRFHGQGEEADDLVQVASVGLTKAVDGFVPSRGHPFLAYALPTIVGEIKRHLRDRVPAVRLPRPLQEASGPVFRTLEELEQRSGGVSPGAEQIAAYLGMETALVTATLRAARVCRPVSMDGAGDGGEAHSAACGAGSADRNIDHVVDVVALTSAVRRLTALERRVLYLRFYRENTQQQIADAVGISQGQVSRRLGSCYRQLREALTTVPMETAEGRPPNCRAASGRLPAEPRSLPPAGRPFGATRGAPGGGGAARWASSAGPSYRARR
ncbi:sigma-70 family RNA polymerase sigma factor [Streptomyces sp. NPDC048197]|uniref:sigma-70 family RNA polymerase sigma factor n=1 Tax=Streptomyces sp. NPDC048197 TaxID=3365511 RepID=UPI0037102065